MSSGPVETGGEDLAPLEAVDATELKMRIAWSCTSPIHGNSDRTEWQQPISYRTHATVAPKFCAV